MASNRTYRAAAQTYRWMLAGTVAAGVYELVTMEIGFWGKLIVAGIMVPFLFVFAFGIEYFIQSAIDPEIPEGWGP